MVIRRDNQQTFHRHMFAGISQPITVWKREDYPNRSVIHQLRIFDCWRSTIRRFGEQYSMGDQVSNHHVTWHIPVIELRKYNVTTFNMLDKIVEDDQTFWQPEAPKVIVYDLMSNYFDVECVRVEANT
jgi:hypothetical protein